MRRIFTEHIQKARHLVEQMTLDEKIGVIHGNGLFRNEGVPRLGVPALHMSDGPMGVRREFANDAWEAVYNTRDLVTYLPCGSAIASTWNRLAAYKAGQVLGSETRGRGKDMILAPSVNIKRSPLCGRNFEYMSEDPYLTAQQAVPFIEGIQENDVAACVKHFVANNQETNRLHVDESISERALQELYLPAFKQAVNEAGVLSVMGAYNLVNGERCCESHTFLGRILRREWDFPGIIVSDWGGVFRTKESAESELDLEMSVTSDFDDYKFAQPLKQAVLDGEVDEKLIDEKVVHIFSVMAALGMFDEVHDADEAHGDEHDGHGHDHDHAGHSHDHAGHDHEPGKKFKRYDEDGNPLPYDGSFDHEFEPVLETRAPGQHFRKEGCYATLGHFGVALEVAQESVVLLKNDNHVLPLDPKTMHNLLVIGANAEQIHSTGGGSAEIKTLYEVSPLLGLCSHIGGNARVDYVPGYEVEDLTAEQSASWQAGSLEDDPQVDADGNVIGAHSQESPERIARRRQLLEEAVKAARNYDHVVFVGGLNHDYDLEGRDRLDMRLPYGQDELIEALLDVKPDMVVVMVAGSPVEMPWADKAQSIVWSWYNGSESGTALAQVLLGAVNPSGHLPESFPIQLSDSPAHAIGTFGKSGHVSYDEDIYVGYRHFETNDIPVRFCFGHGLSYTSFEYSNLRITVNRASINVECTITNTGTVAGHAVPQLYLGFDATGEDRPVKELKGYDKILIEPGHTERVRLYGYTHDMMSYFSKTSGQWEVANSAQVYVGESVQDIRLTDRIDISQA